MLAQLSTGDFVRSFLEWRCRGEGKKGEWGSPVKGGAKGVEGSLEGSGHMTG